MSAQTSRWRDPVLVLGVAVAVLALVASVAGLFWSPAGGVPDAAVSAWGERVALYGRGLYRRDDAFHGAGAEGSDLVTLVLVLPLLAGALWLRSRGSRRASLLVAGGLAWTTYLYASVALGTVVYNELFLVYVAAGSASAFGLGLAVAEGRATFAALDVPERLPRRPLAVFLGASGLATGAIWTSFLATAALAGDPPDRLAHYTGQVTHALDVGGIAPATIVAGVLVWRRRPLGYAVAVPLLVVEALLLPMIAAQTVRQLGAGIRLSPAEMVGPVAGFVVMAAGAVWALGAVLRRVPRRAALAALALFVAGPAAAQAPPGAERFVQAFPVLADSFGVPGAVLAVVEPEGPVALAGYGVADMRTGAPADPERTLFRVASVSKPVTATAVLALAERGALDLHADVNGQLRRLRVPDAFGAAVTPHALLTHTAGFDERIFGSGSATAAPDLQGYLARTLPDRVYPPGALHAYSNHGYGLLGALVEDATGRPFADAMDALVLRPLGMDASTFAQPPPDALRGRLATGHACPDGRASCMPLSYDYVAFAPAGALQTTAADLGRFAAFHLSGRGGALADSTRRLMRRAQWRAHPALGGMAYGWHRGMLGRHEVLRHAGGWAGWSAQAIVVPGAGVGYVVAVNTDERGLLSALAERFAADVLGGPYGPRATPDGDLGRYEGTYRLARHVHHGADRVAVLAGFPMPDLRVEAEGDTALALRAGPSVQRAVPVGGGAFVVPGLDPRRYAFVRDGGRWVIHGDYASLEQISWWATRQTAAWALGAGVLVLAATVLAAAARLVRRRRSAPAALRYGRTLAVLAAGCLLAFALALGAAALTLGPQGLVYGLPVWTRAAFALPLLAGPLALGGTFALALAVRRREGTVAARLALAVAVAVPLALLPVLAYWGLLGIPAW